MERIPELSLSIAVAHFEGNFEESLRKFDTSFKFRRLEHIKLGEISQATRIYEYGNYGLQVVYSPDSTIKECGNSNIYAAILTPDKFLDEIRIFGNLGLKSGINFSFNSPTTLGENAFLAYFGKVSGARLKSLKKF